MYRPYYESDFINDIASGIVHENDIDDYVKTHDAQSLYENIWMEWYVSSSPHLGNAMNYLRNKYRCSWKNEPKQETAKEVKLFRALVNYPDVDKFMEVLHKRHDKLPRSCDRGRLITKCVYGYKYLSRFPSQEEYESEFDYIQKGGGRYSWKGVEKYFDKNDTEWDNIELALD